MPVMEVEVTLQDFTRVGVPPAFLIPDESLALVDQGHQDAADQFVARGEVVVQRGLGDAQFVRDVLQAGLLHALLPEQLPGSPLNAMPGVRSGPAHLGILTYLTFGKRW